MHEANQPYNFGDGAALQHDGRHADSLARLNRYASVLRSYCDKGDPICAGGDDVEKHLNLFEKYTDDASTWAVGKINDVAPLCAAPTPTPSASSTVVASSVGVTSATAASSSGAAASSGAASASSAAASSGAASAHAAAASSGAASASGAAASSGAASAHAAAASSGAASAHAAAASSGAASASGAAASSSVAALPAAPTSPVYVAPFTAPTFYDAMCVPHIKIKYVYA
jgi:hypothetical protein